MRSDYALYALAVIFFVLAAVSFVLVTPVDERNLYVVLTAVLGVMFGAVGYAMKPKTKAVVATHPEPVAKAEEPAPTPTPASAPAPASAEAQPAAVAETPKAEAPVVEAPKPEAAPPMIEAPKVEMAALEKPAEPEALPAAPVAVAPPIVAAAPVQGTSLTQIRGINENRAAQLKANGINNVEELANASAEDLAAKLQVSDKIVKMWIGTAKKLAK
jgi:predicted flap endonuclease-1-like 5' DNA nuclease